MENLAAIDTGLDLVTRTYADSDFVGAWSNVVQYRKSQIATYAGNLWVANAAPSLGAVPGISGSWTAIGFVNYASGSGAGVITSTEWTKLTSDMAYQGAYNGALAYAKGSVVTRFGVLYVATTAIAAAVGPPNTGWDQLGFTDLASNSQPGGISTADFNKLATIAAGAQVNTVTAVTTPLTLTSGAVAIPPASGSTAGSLASADFTKLSALGNVLLDYTASGTLVNGGTVGTGWASLNVSQVVNIPASTSKILVFISGFVSVLNGTSGAAQNCATRMTVDGVATENYKLGGTWVDAAKVGNALAGAGAMYVTGLSAGNHTFGFGVYASANCTFFLRPGSNDYEKLRLIFIEVAR